MKNKKTKPPETAPTSQQVTTEQTKETKPTKFVVTRDGHRVSDREYPTSEDPLAIYERDFWNKVANKHSHGESVTIVQYDSKKHRVW